jgi:hypothetical protein
VLSIAAATGAGSLVAATTGDRSPAGRIAFLRGERLFLMNGDGSVQRFSGWRADGFPVWSPNGRRIAFFDQGRRTSLLVANADGSERRALTAPRLYDCMWMAWSPSGDQIAVTRNGGCKGVIDVLVVNAKGRHAAFRFGFSLNMPLPVWTTRPSAFFDSAYRTL